MGGWSIILPNIFQTLVCNFLELIDLVKELVHVLFGLLEENVLWVFYNWLISIGLNTYSVATNQMLVAPA